MIRMIFILLLAANIGYFGWQQSRAMQAPAEPVNRPIEAPELVLLREREEQLLAEGGVVINADGTDGACFSLGPFSNQADLRQAFNSLAPQVDRLRQRQEYLDVDRGFWVYLPAMETREQALQTARRLANAGIRDYYVVTHGEQENTVSLGLFSERENADTRQRGLIAMGFDAEVTRRTEQSLQFWLDYARGPDSQPDWERIAAAGRVTRKPIPCFRSN